MTLTKERVGSRITEAKSDLQPTKARRRHESRAFVQAQVEELPEEPDLPRLEENNERPNAHSAVAATEPRVVQGSVNFRMGPYHRRAAHASKQRARWRRRSLKPTHWAIHGGFARANWASLRAREQTNVADSDIMFESAIYDPEAMDRVILPLGNLFDIANTDELVSQLQTIGLPTVAQELRNHLESLEEDPDEPPVNLHSVRSLVAFVCAYPRIVTPFVIGNRDGLVGLEWHILDGEEPGHNWDYGKGVVTLMFRPTGFVRLIALCLPLYDNQECPQAQGESKREHVLDSLGEFASMIIRA